jgi:hypothetical protein
MVDIAVSAARSSGGAAVVWRGMRIRRAEVRRARS